MPPTGTKGVVTNATSGGGGGGGGNSAGPTGNLQAANGTGGFAVYSGDQCSQPGDTQYGLTGTGAVLCRPPVVSSLTEPEPWLAQPSTTFPNGFNLGALSPGVVTMTKP